jgi:hypothetical protein
VHKDAVLFFVPPTAELADAWIQAIRRAQRERTSSSTPS